MKKLYYSIGDVSKITGIKPHVLRYWETVFDSLNPQKNRAGNRVYTERNLQTVHKLKKLIQNEGYSTAGAKKVISAQKNKPQEHLPDDMQNDFKKIRTFLNNLLHEI